jgi:RHS repeat-associated protein
MYDSGNGTTGFGMRGRGGAARPFLPTCARQNSPQFPVYGVRLRLAWQLFRGKPQARLLSLLLVLISVGASDVLANSLPPVAVVNFYPERSPLSASNHGRMITGEEVTFDGRSSYTTRSGTVITTYRWFVNGSQTQSGTSPVFTYTAGDAGTNVTIGLEVRDSYGTWPTRGNVVMEVAPIPQRYYYVTDHLGSVRALTNELGELVAYSDYYPFGLEMPKRSLAGDDATKEGFAGHELDAETGLNYAGARYYDPDIGRWLPVDPHAASYPAFSPYNYTLNNPLTFVDLDGRDPVFSDSLTAQHVVDDLNAVMQRVYGTDEFAFSVSHSANRLIGDRVVAGHTIVINSNFDFSDESASEQQRGYVTSLLELRRTEHHYEVSEANHGEMPGAVERGPLVANLAHSDAWSRLAGGQVPTRSLSFWHRGCAPMPIGKTVTGRGRVPLCTKC